MAHLRGGITQVGRRAGTRGAEKEHDYKYGEQLNTFAGFDKSYSGRPRRTCNIW